MTTASITFLPSSVRRESAATERDATGFANAMLFLPLVVVVFLAKLAVPPFGAQGIGLAIPLIWLAVVGAVVRGALRFHLGRSIWFLFTVAWLGLSSVLQPNFISLSSFALLLALHMPFVFELDHTSVAHGDANRPIRFLLGAATLIAWCGIVQFIAQFLVGPAIAFPIENFVPTQFLVQLFNAQGTLGYGSTVFRTNGVFLLEPSYLSQFLAVAIVAELCTTSRMSRLVLFGLAMVFSYSGTGIMILAVCLPVLLAMRQRWDIIFGGVLFLAILFAAREYLYLDQFFSRSTEFNSQGSSGFARFISGFYLFDKYLWVDPAHALFGYGTGTFRTFAERFVYPIAEMPLFKMPMEFGVLGSIVYFSFLIYCFFNTAAPKMVALAVLMTALLNGLYVPFSQGLAVTLLMWPGKPGRIAA